MKDTLFKINDFEVKKDSIYVVKDKRDMDAPSGFIKAGVSKLPSKGVGDTFQVRFISRDGGRTGTWDTGFYEFSHCYKAQDKDSVKPLITSLKKNVLEPFRKAIGDPLAFEQENEKFFLKQRFSIFSGKVFNTSDPVDTMELYFGLLTNQLTPKGQEGNTKFNDSSYVVVDINKDVKVKDERALEKFKAVGSFTNLLSSDKERLLAMLSYAGINPSKSVDDVTLISMFNDYLDQGQDDRIIMFNALVTETETEKGLEKVFIYKQLRSLIATGKVTKTSGLYYYDGNEIGPDLKQASESIVKNSKFAGIKKEIMLNS